MDIFDLLLNYKYIGMQLEVAARCVEKCEVNAARNRKELEAKVSSCRRKIPADTLLWCTYIKPVHSSLFVFSVSSLYHPVHRVVHDMCNVRHPLEYRTIG